MPQINSRLKVFTGLYDFAIDGGGIGTINLKVPIQGNSVIMSLVTKTLIAPLSGGAATLALGVSNVNTGGVMPAQAFNSVQFVLSTIAISAVPTGLNGVPSLGGSLQLTIAGAALTAGKILFTITVAEMDV